MADNTCLPRRRAPLSQLFQPDLPPEAPATDAIGATLTVTIDGMETKVPLGTTILEAAKSIGVRIPTLCYHPDLDVAGICRICVVEVEGQRTLQAACAYPITAPIKIKTYSKAVRIARRHVLDLLLSEHCGDCYSCIRNGICELQQLAEEYGVDSFRFGHVEEPVEIDASSFSIVRDMNKCIRCRRCVRTCIDMQEVGVLEAMNRSNKVEVSTFMHKPLGNEICINCGQCINRCPTAALYANPALDQVWKALDDPTKHVVIQTAPSPRAAVGECFGLEPGTSVTYEMNTALKRMGFDHVFDTNFTADLTIIEEGTELILRLYKALVEGDKSVALPQFLMSCSPGWVKYCEHFYPEYIPNLSSAKSLAADVRRADQDLLRREDGRRSQGHRQRGHHAVLGQEVRVQPSGDERERLPGCRLWPHHPRVGCDDPSSRFDLPTLPKPDFDDPFGGATGSGLIFGATGGVMESALRTVIELVTGEKVESIFEHGDIMPVRGFEGVRYAELTIPKVGPVPDILKPLVPNWDWLKEPRSRWPSLTAQRTPRRSWKPSRPAASSASATSLSSWPAQAAAWRRWSTDAHQQRDPGRAGQRYLR